MRKPIFDLRRISRRKFFIAAMLALSLAVAGASQFWSSETELVRGLFNQETRASAADAVLVNNAQAPRSFSGDAEIDGIRARAAEIFADPHAPVGGNPEGDVTIVLFSDYTCGACRKMFPILTQAEKEDPDLRILYKEFPIRGPDSTRAARAALAAHRQGKYLEFHKALMTAQSYPTLCSCRTSWGPARKRR